MTANAAFNLTAIRDPAEIERRHILESLALAPALERQGLLTPDSAVIDIGSGGGLPGIPLAILRPDLHLTLLEATRKKADFLREMAHVLGLERVDVLAMRAEAAGHDPTHRERYDLAVARAVAPLDVLAELALPLVRAGGALVAVKGARVEQEVATARAALRRCGGDDARIIPYQGGGTELTLVLCRKVAPTPAELPRRAGMPAKRPLR